MFDLLASGMQAYAQIGMFMGALICLGLGGLLLGNSLYWRVHGIRTSGTVIGVIAKNNMYKRVYRYALPGGQTYQATTDIGRSWLRGSETGRDIPLLISSHNPASAREADSYLFEIGGIIIVVPGVLLGYTAFTAYPITPMTWIMAVAMPLYLAERGYHVLIPKGQRLSLAEWRKQRGLGETAINMAEVQPAETILSTPEQARQIQWQRKLAPLMGLFAVILIAIAFYQGNKIARLEADGLRAAGQVVRLYESEDQDGHSSYYPVVQYRTEKNLAVEFKDSIGSNPPSRRPGDKVTVLYLADNPERDAIIDRGRWWNWAIPAILTFGAAFVAWIGIVMLRTRTRQKHAADT